jgi:hypothetical protein
MSWGREVGKRNDVYYGIAKRRRFTLFKIWFHFLE